MKRRLSRLGVFGVPVVLFMGIAASWRLAQWPHGRAEEWLAAKAKRAQNLTITHQGLQRVASVSDKATIGALLESLRCQGNFTDSSQLPTDKAITKAISSGSNLFYCALQSAPSQPTASVKTSADFDNLMITRSLSQPNRYLLIRRVVAPARLKGQTQLIVTGWAYLGEASVRRFEEIFQTLPAQRVPTLPFF